MVGRIWKAMLKILTMSATKWWAHFSFVQRRKKTNSQRKHWNLGLSDAYFHIFCVEVLQQWSAQFRWKRISAPVCICVTPVQVLLDPTDPTNNPPPKEWAPSLAWVVSTQKEWMEQKCYNHLRPIFSIERNKEYIKTRCCGLKWKRLIRLIFST